MFSKKSTLNVKGIAICLLLFHHLFFNESRVVASGAEFRFVSYDMIQPLAVMARVCVWIFVFLSAYGLSYQFKNRADESITKYLIKRWLLLMKSFWPMYIVVALIFTFIGKQSLSNLYKGSIKNMLLDLFSWADFFGTPMITSVWWYMCLAQVIIFMIPMVYYACEKLGGSIIPVAYIILQYIPEGIKSPYGGRYSIYFMAIVLGCLFVKYDIMNKLLAKEMVLWKKLISIMLCMIGIVVLIYGGNKLTGIDEWNLKGVLYSFAAVLSSYVVAANLHGTISDRTLGFLGKHSANIFMCHPLIYRFMPEVVYWSSEPFLQYASLLVVSLMISIVVEWIKDIIKYNEFYDKKVVRIR